MGRMQIPKVLAIDYGTVRVGIAVSAGELADPVVVLPNTPQLYAQIVELATSLQAELLLVGLSENKMAEYTQEFAQKLKEHTNLPLLFADETLSSYIVHKKLLHAKKSKRSGAIDHYAAAEFLQAWLDEYEKNI